MSEYHARIIDNLNDWEQVRDLWNELLGKSASDNIFLTCEWLYSWAECFINGFRELFIVLVYKDNALIGIAPWYIEKVSKGICSIRQIHFIGTPEAGSDYLDVLIKKGKEKEVANFLYDFLLGSASNKWDRIRLCDIPANSLFLLHFISKIRGAGKYVTVTESSFCPIAVLGSTEEDFFSGLSSNRRELFRRHLKVLNKNDSVVHQNFSGENIDAPVNDFFNFYNKKTKWRNNNNYRLISKFTEKNGGENVQINLLAIGDAYIGGLLHLKYKDTLYMYAMAIDKEFNKKISIGNIIVGITIINAMQSGISFYDFLKGEESYKFHWTNYGKRACSIVFSQKKFMPICFTLAELGKSAARLLLR